MQEELLTSILDVLVRIEAHLAEIDIRLIGIESVPRELSAISDAVAAIEANMPLE